MRLVFFILITVVFASCDSDRVFEDNKDFASRSWAVSDTVNFEFQITEKDVLYNLHCNIRSTLDYPYSRIFVNYTLQDSTHKVLATKLVSSYLFDGKTGEPTGSSGLGDIYDHRFALLKDRAFMPGKYFVTLRQEMRTDTSNVFVNLPGILAAGVRVEKSHQ